MTKNEKRNVNALFIFDFSTSVCFLILHITLSGGAARYEPSDTSVLLANSYVALRVNVTIRQGARRMERNSPKQQSVYHRRSAH
jgi:hypothetical protein